MKHRLGRLALLALLGLACGEPRLLEGFTEGQTRIRLLPSAFIGDVACRRGVTGALQSYVVLLQEVPVNATAPDAGFITAYTAGPVPCDEAVMFPAVAGRLYGAEIYGFDREVTEGVSLASARWTSVCGRGRSLYEASDAGLDPYRPTFSQRAYTVPMRGCTPFSESGVAAPTRLVVDTASALGSLRCGSGPGQVYAFRGTLDGVTHSALCEAPLVFDVPEPNRYYSIALTGLAADGDAGVPGADASPPPATPEAGSPLDAGADASTPDELDASVGPPAPGALDAGVTPAPEGVARWQTRCIGRALEGVTAPAVCDPLSALPGAL